MSGAHSGLGRDVLEVMLTAAQGEVSRLEKELRRSAMKVDEDACVMRLYTRQITELQARGTQMLEAERVARRAEAGLRVMLDMHPLAPLLVSLRDERALRPAGATVLQLGAAFGEAARAEEDAGLTREGRQEALRRVAVIALRLSLDEEARHDIRLKGWKCERCQSFNGEEHSPRTTCRSCGTVK